MCVHNKFALAIIGFQFFPSYLVSNFTRLQVCYLCSYVWIDHFLQITNFCSVLIDLLWTCVLNMFSNLTQLVGVPFNSVVIDLGCFAVVEPSSFSSSSRLCVACNSASIFSYHIRPSCSSCCKRNSVKRRSSSRCCSCLASNRFLSIFSSISSCVLFKNFATFSLSTKNVQ